MWLEKLINNTLQPCRPLLKGILKTKEKNISRKNNYIASASQG